ncbi:CPBP family intramembrane glutamic endopeptidase [Flammeovirga sp. SubArs3]|uniref:CPBP family intramembrane glutamic endopeptidase n=1 Tax=Flammeovirga sp. SubArs3 TaxID=2995316 RepID=UPI00248B9DB5|nr:CPBP family intramembrane glutamic endopeptidase [Flammeovirga sp. SubArs3]
MTDHTFQSTPFEYFKKFLLVILSVVCFTFVGQFVIVALLLPLHHYEISEVFSSLGNYESRFEVLLSQAISAIFTFILGPVVFGWKYDLTFTKNLRRPSTNTQQYLLAMLVMAAFLPLGSAILVWNQHIEFPPAFQALEASFKASEMHLAEVTAFLVDFQSIWEFLFGFIVIALLAGIGEEILFRGYIQRYLEGMFNNVHVGIWLSAILFSAIHMQFYGFFVRMFLGVLLGYLFLWSGRSLYPSILAHITNNAITVISVYVNKDELLPEMKDPFSAEAPEWYIIIITTLIAFGILFYYRKLKNLKTS